MREASDLWLSLSRAERVQIVSGIVVSVVVTFAVWTMAVILL